MKSESIAKLADALAKAQKVIKSAAKDATNPHFKSKYADLPAVWDACREPLTTNGLSVTQTTRVLDNGTMSLVTTLLHTSGEWVEGDYLLNPVKTDPQGFGSAMTYARRYALMAIAGIAPDEDDGESAQGRGNNPQQNQSDQQHDQRSQDGGVDQRVAWVGKAVAAIKKIDTRDALDKWWNTNKPYLDALTEDQHKEVCSACDSRIGAMKSPPKEGQKKQEPDWAADLNDDVPF